MKAFCATVLAAFTFGATAQSAAPDLRAANTLQLIQVRAENVVYRGRQAVRITDIAPKQFNDAGRLAIVRNSQLKDGAIDVDLTGDTAPNADPIFRGFVGLAFRVSKSAESFECIYIRTKNGRSADQLQRNHSTQYISIPGFPWQKLRSETPGKYESYVDLEPGKWTHIRVEVSGRSARLFVDKATQPALVVEDLKQPIDSGSVALWIGPGTIAHFTNLKVAVDH